MKTVIGLLLVLASNVAFADQSVRGYTKKDGTYVQPHHRSEPNSTRNDNYSTKGNTNPYTGQPGTKSDDSDSLDDNNHSYGSNQKRGY